MKAFWQVFESYISLSISQALHANVFRGIILETHPTATGEFLCSPSCLQPALTPLAAAAHALTEHSRAAAMGAVQDCITQVQFVVVAQLTVQLLH